MAALRFLNTDHRKVKMPQDRIKKRAEALTLTHV
jgi:hypothetical protein